ncbi:recombination regulator RecX [Clostridium tarantellae]|uniref:Regulatory protein RecX n=1 Tax=Clostridium tarantellae TaxID=39493 RepID=A0A6I1MIL5_9CLOT|nr:recombination regulator RecX [Clostridium tarantellae]MPQ42970.1 recombination regulator RecX [Clostridium tarantellae]
MSKITNIEMQKRNKNRVNVYIDEDFAFACDLEIVYKQGLKKDLPIDLLKIKEIVYRDEIIKCKNSALKTLEKSYKTEKEMKEKLLLKGYSEEIILQAFISLKEYNLINDKKFVEMYIKDKGKIQGRNKIKYNLIKKGINEELINENLNKLDEVNEKEIALNLAKKKYDILVKRESDKFKLSQKLNRFLIGKGYSYDCTKEIIKTLTNHNSFME